MRKLSIPAVTVDQMRQVDKLMVEEIGVSILMMMEDASRNIAILSRKLLGGTVQGKKIVILSGKGNNGGDGLIFPLAFQVILAKLLRQQSRLPTPSP